MFSGIVQGQARIVHRDQGLFVVENIFNEELVLGQSIAHDGACMTVTDVYADRYGVASAYSFFVMEESLTKTDLGSTSLGSILNVELCIRYGDRIDGHFVTGHIDTTAELVEKTILDDGSWVLVYGLDAQRRKYLVEKGSVALNGVSLTVVDVFDSGFSVSVIPYTLVHTNLGQLEIGVAVNVEFDMLGKYVLQK